MMQYGIPELTAAELMAWLEAGRPVQLVDVRTEPEHRGGTIPGALHLPLHLLPLRYRELAVGAAGEDVPVVVFCRTGSRSAQAVLWLSGQSWGGRVMNLRGGIMAWLGAGGTLVTPSVTAVGQA